jgi:hypothetical protein
MPGVFFCASVLKNMALCRFVWNNVSYYMRIKG